MPNTCYIEVSFCAERRGHQGRAAWVETSENKPIDLPALLLIELQTHIQKPSAVRVGAKEQADGLE